MKFPAAFFFAALAAFESRVLVRSNESASPKSKKKVCLKSYIWAAAPPSEISQA